MFWRYYDESIIKYIIWHFVFTSCIKDFFFWFLGVYLLTLKTEYLIFPESNCIILNCTYHNGNYERIRDTYIRWQKLIDGEFKDIAVFSPPGGLEPFITKDMQQYIQQSDISHSTKHLALRCDDNKGTSLWW